MADIMIDADEIPPLDDTPDEAPAEKVSLDDVISKAIDAAETPADEPESDGRVRDEHGRFVAKDKTESEASEAPPEGTSETAPVVASTEPKPEAQPEPVSEGHFRGWSPDQVAAFKTLPAEAQKLALDVVKGRDAHYSKQVAEYEQAVNFARPLVNAIAPHVNRIRAATNGGDPAAYVQHVLDIDYRLTAAPYAEKVQLLAQLAKQIGVPFQNPEPDPFADPLTPGGQAYPVIHDLQTQVQQLQQQVQSYQLTAEQAEQQRSAALIRDFASQANADGTPKYPLFEQVKGTMGQLLSAGKAASMEEAYGIAAKPILDMVAAQTAAQVKAAEAAKQAALEKARKVRPVRTSGVAPGGKTSGSQGLDAIISGALDRAGFN